MVDLGAAMRQRAVSDPIYLSAVGGLRESDGRFLCHVCEREVPVLELPDEELECSVCKATCVERIETEAHAAGHSAQTVERDPPPPPPPTRSRVRPSREARARLRQEFAGLAGRHVGIRCDGCNVRDFQGVRYRCLHCPDFDFCATCHSQRSALHPGHEFETIVTPRSILSPFMMSELLGRSSTRTSIAIIGFGMGANGFEANSGLTDADLAWWLADSRRLVSIDEIAAMDAAWACPICAEGLEAECENGWVVQICGPTADEGVLPSRGSSSGGTDDGGEAEEGTVELNAQRHVYHEACLRKWLLKRNSCPVCRRSPVVPQV